MTRVEIGRIVRLQIQKSSLKAREGRLKHYDPTPLAAVDAIMLTTHGVTIDAAGGIVLDVHHARHPLSKNRALTNGVSVGFTSHYERMRERFGPHLTNGVAGENILVDSDRAFCPDDIAGGLVIECGDGRRVPLESISVAHPCAEFSRFALDDREAPPLIVSETLRYLDNGLRGYYAVVPSDEPQLVQVGDRVCLAAP